MLVALVFNVLVTASPKELAGDVGPLRGTTRNLAAAVGTALAGGLLVGLLSGNIMRALAERPILTPELPSQIDLDNITLVSNERLLAILERTTATLGQVAEAMRINTDSRLGAPKIGRLVMADLSPLAIIPAGGLPACRSGELPAAPPEPGTLTAIADEERFAPAFEADPAAPA